MGDVVSIGYLKKEATYFESINRKRAKEGGKRDFGFALLANAKNPNHCRNWKTLRRKNNRLRRIK